MTHERAILFEAAKAAFLKIHQMHLALFAETGRVYSWQQTAEIITDCDDDCDRKVLVRLGDGRIVQSNVDRKIGRTA